MKKLLIIISALLVISCSKSEYGWKWGKKYSCTTCSHGEWIRLEKPDKITVYNGTSESTYTFTINGSGLSFSNNSLLYVNSTFMDANGFEYK